MFSFYYYDVILRGFLEEEEEVEKEEEGVLRLTQARRTKSFSAELPAVHSVSLDSSSSSSPSLVSPSFGMQAQFRFISPQDSQISLQIQWRQGI